MEHHNLQTTLNFGGKKNKKVIIKVMKKKESADLEYKFVNVKK